MGCEDTVAFFNSQNGLRSRLSSKLHNHRENADDESPLQQHNPYQIDFGGKTTSWQDVLEDTATHHTQASWQDVLEDIAIPSQTKKQKCYQKSESLELADRVSNRNLSRCRFILLHLTADVVECEK